MSETTTSDAAARVQLVEAPNTAPGCCALCGKSKHELGFATPDNLDFEFFGRLFICGDCVGDFARLFGWISPEQYEGIKEHVAGLEQLNLALLQDLNDLGDIKNAIDYYGRRHIVDSHDNSSTIHVADDQTADENNNSKSGSNSNEPAANDENNSGSADEQSNVNESVNESRPVSLPGATSDVAELLGELG